VKPDGFPAGVEAIFGFKGDGGSEIQSVAFDSSMFSPAQAKKWLEDNKLSSAGFEEAKGDHSDGSSVRFDDLGDGVSQRQVRRFDLMSLAKPEITPDGFVRAQGMITRAGVFEYKRQDGTIIRELRPPEQVFRSDSLRSFSGMPLTLDHPSQNLTPKTVGEHTVGTVSSPTRINDHVRADITILREDAIKAVMNDRKNKLSCGYVCTVVDQAGTYVHSDGTEERFDAVQMDILGNHVAICDNPRAGPSAEIRVDDAFADISNPEKPRGDSTMEVEITINGKTYRVSKTVADQMKADGVLEAKKEEKKEDDATTRAIKEAQEERDRLRGEKAALEAKISSEKKDEEKKKDKQASKDATKARVELCAVASGILETKLDELLDMDDLDIMKAVIVKQAPDFKLDGEGEAVIRGAFKTIVATKVDTSKEIQKLINGGKPTEEKGDKSWEAEADKAREASIQHMQDAWKPASMREAEKEIRERNRS
jgi:hypothetical protein